MSEKKASILVVDDEPDLRLLYELTLMREGYQVESAETVAQARAKLERSFDVVLTDMRLPDGQGMELLLELQAASRPERCIVVTAYGSAENAIEALRAGAFDYLSKPVELKQLRSVVASAIQGLPGKTPPAAPAAPTAAQATVQAATPAPGQRKTAQPSGRADSALAADKATDKGAAALADLVGQSPLMQAVKERIGKVARSMAPVHIHGESGTGKELVARALHANSQRADGPLVAVNCGAIPENLLEAEFFGAKKGSYTGATHDRGGFFQAAKGGTLFLDEIGDLPLAMQTKLLRAIQERSVRPLGATQEEVVDVRLVSATHRDLATEVAEGRFRQDLYYRLNVIELRIPPLRERREDLPALIAALLQRLTRDSPFDTLQTDPAFMDAVLRRPFPGNVRELENLLHRAVALSEDGVLRAEYIKDTGEAFAPPPPTSPAAAIATAAAPTPAPTFSMPTPVSYTGFAMPAFQSSALPAPTPPPPATPPATAPVVAAPPAIDTVAPAQHVHAAAETPAIEPASTASIAVSARRYDDLADLPKDLQAWLDEQERAVLIRALKAVNYNRTAAASLLGLNLRQMRYRIERLNIPTEPDTRE